MALLGSFRIKKAFYPMLSEASTSNSISSDFMCDRIYYFFWDQSPISGSSSAQKIMGNMLCSAV